MAHRRETGRIPMQMERSDYECYHFRTPFEPVEVHVHDFYEIYILLSDSVHFVIDGRQYYLKRHDILLISPQELHHPIAVGDDLPYERLDVYISPEFIASHGSADANLRTCFDRSARRPGANLLRPGPRLTNRIIETVYTLREQGESDLYGRGILEEALVLQLLVYLNQASFVCSDRAAQDVQIDDKVDEMIRFIGENLSAALDLDQLSARFFLSKYHLVRVFKRHTGLTPHQFIRYKRLLKARLLMMEGHSVTEACSECGFVDYSNFIRAFREEFGVSPGRYAGGESFTEERVPRVLRA